jgi:RNA polymerase sigma factor (sigma-70 family)
MSEGDGFAELLAQVRAGDNAACAEVERRYGDTLRRMARVRLAFYDLQRRVNPSDVVQSVMAVFFNKAAGGEYEFKVPEDILKLLRTMVERKVNDHRRKAQAVKRSRGKADGSQVDAIPDSEPSPSLAVAEREMFEKVWDGLDAADRDLVRLVVWDKRSWQEVADHVGATAEAARKRYERLLEKVRARWAGSASHE